ncbi:MAG: phosphate propanoyltransferase [Desulfitobacteriaceae bacterium]
MEQTQLVEWITREVLAQLQIQPLLDTQAKVVPVAVSVRHVHLAQAEIDVLFGRGYNLKKLKDLYQPGEFAAQEVVALVGPKLRSLAGVRVLGPVRARTQVEISRTDAITIGLEVPVRPSGQLKGAAAITIVGPQGSLTLPDCCIVANRHIHINTENARAWGLKDNQPVQVRVKSVKPSIMGDVQVRVGSSSKLILHIDTDDANAMDLQCGNSVEIMDEE